MTPVPQQFSETCTPFERINRAKYLYMLSPTEENFKPLMELQKQYLQNSKSMFPHPHPRSKPIQFLEPHFFHEDYHMAIHPHLPETPLDWHYHDFFELIYVCRGSFQHLLKGTFFSMEQGDLCIVPPNQSHAITSTSPDGIVLNILIRKSTFRETFTPLLKENDLISTFFAHTLFKKENTAYLLFRCSNDPVIHNMITAMYEEYISFREYSRSILTGQLIMLLGQLLRNHQQDGIQMHGRSQPQPTQISRILKYISDNLQIITLQEVAREFHYSSGRCSNLIKEATGMTFREIVRKERAVQASHLLLNTDLSLMKIAEKVGFCDASHFHRTFAQIYGTPPSQFRKDNYHK